MFDERSASNTCLKSTITSPIVQILSRLLCDSVETVGEKILNRSTDVTADFVV